MQSTECRKWSVKCSVFHLQNVTTKATSHLAKPCAENVNCKHTTVLLPLNMKIIFDKHVNKKSCASHTKRFATRDHKRLNVTKCHACLPPKTTFHVCQTSKHDNFWSARQQNSHMAFFVKPQTPERRDRTDLRASAAQGKFRCASSSNLHNPNESP
jgi:hypothetical protein